MSTSTTTPMSSDYSLALYTFLDRLSPIMFHRLYSTPSSCLNIFRLLPLTSRHIVLNYLWLDNEQGSTKIERRELEGFVRQRKSDGKEPNTHLNQSLEALARLQILTTPTTSSDLDQDDDGFNNERLSVNEEVYVLNDKFRKNLRQALTGGGKSGAFGTLYRRNKRRFNDDYGADEEEEEEKVTIGFLDRHAETQWETIQHYMVGSTDPNRPRPSEKVLQLLWQSGLMFSETRSLRSMRITSKGFQFLLEDVNTQLWDLLLCYLEGSEDLVDTISFLFMLGSLELGRAYTSEGLSNSQSKVLSDLSDYGLVYKPKPTSHYFYPTRLATTLTSSAPPLLSTLHSSSSSSNTNNNDPSNPTTATSANEGVGGSGGGLGFLVIETNYKLYAYTSNPLQIAVIGLFCQLKTRFANFVTGMITRESVRRGLENGITANQIISYLTTRAHPQMIALHLSRQGKHNEDQNLLPTTVVDQIRLWEHERRRIQDVEGYLYDDFSSSHDYDLVCTYARDLNVVLLELPKQRKLVVTSQGHLQVREFIKRRMAAIASGTTQE